MKKLIPVFDNDREWALLIINSKATATRSAIMDIYDSLSQCWINYEDNLTELQNLSPYGFGEELSTLLKSCYKVRTLSINSLKDSILDAQSGLDHCPYCGIDTAETFDHYLSKAIFPEFSFFSLNLVPCCYRCNGDKGDFISEDENRGIINYYFDDIFETEFLSATLEYGDDSSEIPSVQFFLLENEGLDDDKRKLLASHFSRLKLFERYKDKVKSEISEILRTHTTFVVPDINTDKLRSMNNEYADKLSRSYGLNYWRAVIRRAVSGNDRFLNYLLSQIRDADNS